MIHIATSPSSTLSPRLSAQSFETTEFSRAWQALHASDVQNNRWGVVRVWSVNRFWLHIVVMARSVFFSLCLSLQLPPAKQHIRALTPDKIANDLANIHRSTPKTLALSALLQTGPSAVVSQFLRQHCRHNGCRRWAHTKSYVDKHPPLGDVVGKGKGS